MVKSGILSVECIKLAQYRLYLQYTAVRSETLAVKIGESL